MYSYQMFTCVGPCAICVFFCSEWYDPEAFLLNEEGVVTSGLLMALSVLDYNVIMKGEDFDRSVSGWGWGG